MFFVFNLFAKPVHVDSQGVFVHKLSVMVPKPFQQYLISQQLAPMGSQLF